jgi:hypothetical protein
MEMPLFSGFVDGGRCAYRVVCARDLDRSGFLTTLCKDGLRLIKAFTPLGQRDAKFALQFGNGYMRALGTIVEAPGGPLSNHDYYCDLLDYYDHWTEVDPRLQAHYPYLSRAAGVLGHDLVNMATYTHEILGWLAPESIAYSPSVVSVGGMTEAFLFSARSAADAIAIALGYKACEKPGQAPAENGLAKLTKWVRKNQQRVHPEISSVLSADLDWFWKLRKLRDQLAHRGADSVIHTDGRQFNLWVHSPHEGWIMRTPLLPLLVELLCGLTALGDRSAIAINRLIDFPADRIRSRVVTGAYVPALHNLIAISHQYAKPSP